MTMHTTTKTAVVTTIALLFASFGAAQTLVTGDNCTLSYHECVQNQEIESTKDAVDTLDTAASTLSSDIDALQDRLDRDEAIGKAALNRLAAVEQDATDLENRVAALEADHVSQSDVADVAADLDAVITAFETERAAIYEQLDKHDTRINENADRINALDQATYTQNEIKALLAEKYDRATVDQLVADLDAATYTKGEVETLLASAAEETYDRATTYADEHDRDTTIGFGDWTQFMNRYFDALVDQLRSIFATNDRVAELEQRVAQQQATIDYLTEQVDAPSDTGTIAAHMAANNLSMFQYGEKSCEVFTTTTGEKRVRCVQ